MHRFVEPEDQEVQLSGSGGEEPDPHRPPRQQRREPPKPIRSHAPILTRRAERSNRRALQAIDGRLVSLDAGRSMVATPQESG